MEYEEQICRIDKYGVSNAYILVYILFCIGVCKRRIIGAFTTHTRDFISCFWINICYRVGFLYH